MKRMIMTGLTVAIMAMMTGNNVGNAVEVTPVEVSRVKVISPNIDKPYLGVDGAFTLDTSEAASQRDPRNVGRIVFDQAKTFSFYRDMAGNEPIAENCEYVYRGARPDPFYYPQFPGSIWDLFELAPGNELCSAFRYVALRAPHGEPIHMHVRYGDERSSFKKLLRLSDSAEDPTKLNPWWSVYCAAGQTACD